MDIELLVSLLCVFADILFTFQKDEDAKKQHEADMAAAQALPQNVKSVSECFIHKLHLFKQAQYADHYASLLL